MKNAAAVLVATMVLLAGCSGGGGTATPTESDGVETAGSMATPASDTPSDSTPTSGSSADGTPTDGPPIPNDGADDSTNTQEGTPSGVDAVLSDFDTAGSDPLSDATRLEATLYNGSERITSLTENDTESGEERIRIEDTTGSASTLYTTTEYVAFRNATSGAVQYGEAGGTVGLGVGFTSVFVVFGSLSYVSFLEWQDAGTTSVDGATGSVYEASSLNGTALSSNENIDLGFDRNEVQSVDGELVIGADGRLRSVDVQIETASGTFGSDLSASYDRVTVSTPDWVDETRVP